MSKPLFQNTFVLRRSRVTNFADIIKIPAIFIKTIFKDLKKVKRIESMYSNAIYIRISHYNKSKRIPVKKCLSQ